MIVIMIFLLFILLSLYVNVLGTNPGMIVAETICNVDSFVLNIYENGMMIPVSLIYFRLPDNLTVKEIPTYVTLLIETDTVSRICFLFWLVPCLALKSIWIRFWCGWQINAMLIFDTSIDWLIDPYQPFWLKRFSSFL